MYPQGACRIRKAAKPPTAAQYFKIFKPISWGERPAERRSRFIQRFPSDNAPERKKSSDLSIGASCWRYLSSRAVTRKVLSAQMSLTSVFGMGTGVPSPQSTPTIYLSSGFCPRTFIIIPPLDSLVKRFFGDPSGIRTHVNGVRGRCLNHLTMGPWCTFTDSNRGPTD